MKFPIQSGPTPPQERLLWFTLSAIAATILLGLLGLLVWGLGRVLHILSPVLWPIAVAGVLAYLMDPVVDFLVRRRVPRPRAIVCVFAMALAVLLAILGSIVPQVVTETRALVERVPTYAERLQQSAERWVTNQAPTIRQWLGTPPEPAGTPAATVTNGAPATVPAPAAADAGGAAAPSTWWAQAIGGDGLQSATSWLARVLPAVGQWIFGQVTKVASWFGVLAGLALVPVYAFYFLLEKRGIESKWTDYLPVSDSAFKQELVFVIGAINDYLIAFFRGQVLVAICDGVLYTIGFISIGLPYAVLLGVVATCLTIIPFLGAIVTCFSALVIAFVQFGDWQHPALVLAVFAVVQSLEGFVIQPKIMGDRVGLHPLTIIIAVMVGTTLLGGLIGGILAIPLTAALRVLMFRYVWRRPDTHAAPGGPGDRAASAGASAGTPSG